MLTQDTILPGARVLHITKLLLLAGLLAACVVPEASASPGTVKQASVEGALDKPAVREVVKAHIVEVRKCYNAELVEDETVAGSVVVSFVIQPDGWASEVGVPESTMPARFDACVITAVEGWSFPASDAETRVSYPFEMSPG
jgi:outer membrane biosynthesis protein TonB